MSEMKEISGTIAADWWVLAGATQALLHRDRDAGAPRYTSGPASAQGGYQFNLSDPQRIGERVGVLWLSTDPGATTVRIEVAPELHNWCIGLYRFLDMLAGSALIFLREFQPSPEQLIERYYLANAQGRRVTLRQLAEETGVSYSTLRKRKMEYDRAGKLGSKRNKLGTK